MTVTKDLFEGLEKSQLDKVCDACIEIFKSDEFFKEILPNHHLKSDDNPDGLAIFNYPLTWDSIGDRETIEPYDMALSVCNTGREDGSQINGVIDFDAVILLQASVRFQDKEKVISTCNKLLWRAFNTLMGSTSNLTNPVTSDPTVQLFQFIRKYTISMTPQISGETRFYNNIQQIEIGIKYSMCYYD